MGRKKGRFIIFIVFLILGVIISMQFRTLMEVETAKTDTSAKLQELIREINRLRETNESLEERIAGEMKRGTELEYQFLRQQSDKSLEQLYEDLQTAMLKAGLVDVQGPGITLKLDDAQARQNMEKGSLVIHDSDIKALLNDLKIAGAQAISINGERIVAMSEQICAGPTIRINWRKYAVPYSIYIIGDPDMLNRTLKSSERLAYMMRDRIKVDMKTTRNVQIPGFKTGSKNLGDYISMLEVVANESE